MANDYNRLAAIVATTKERSKPLELTLISGADAKVEDKDMRSLLWLAIVRDGKQLASVPFNPKDPDAAARDIARKLTLDGSLPRGMEDD